MRTKDGIKDGPKKSPLGKTGEVAAKAKKKTKDDENGEEPVAMAKIKRSESTYLK